NIRFMARLSAMRPPTGSSGGVDGESITRAMNRVQQLHWEGLVDRRAQRMHVCPQEIALRRTLAPELPLELGARDDPMRVLHQHHQDAPRRGVELDALAAAFGFERVEVELQVADGQHARRSEVARAAYE